MSSRVLEVVLWMGAALSLVVGAAGARRLNAETRATDASSRAVSIALPAPRSDEAALDAIDVIAEGNLFRPDRARAAEPAASGAVAEGAPSPPAPPKPALKLRGLVGGPPWDALIEGIPGREGAVVARVGQTLGGITVRAVRRDTVIAQGMDTTWKLTLARSWQVGP